MTARAEAMGSAANLVIPVRRAVTGDLAPQTPIEPEAQRSEKGVGEIFFHYFS
jgi:hypothetical protein